MEEQQEEIEQLQRRLSELEAASQNGAPAGNGASPEPKAKAKPAPRASSAKRARSTNGRAPKTTRPAANRSARSRGTKQSNGNGRTPKKTAKLDLNEATFDQLRGLGLSINQSSRLISYREADGGFASVDDLGEIKGLAKDTVAKLRSQVRVAARA